MTSSANWKAHWWEDRDNAERHLLHTPFKFAQLEADGRSSGRATLGDDRAGAEGNLSKTAGAEGAQGAGDARSDVCSPRRPE
jgi:hypothetical protein